MKRLPLGRIQNYVQSLSIGVMMASACLGITATSALAADPSHASSKWLSGHGIFDCPPNSFNIDLNVTGSVAEINVDISVEEPLAEAARALSIEFKGTDLVARSSKVSWLMIGPNLVEVKGHCTLDGAEGFSFIMRIGETDRAGKTLLRLKIWETNRPNYVLFDNQRGEDWTAPFRVSSALLGGNIAIR